MRKITATVDHEASSLSRVWQHTQTRNIGAITAFRGENTLQENRALNGQLTSAIRGAGFGFIRIKGRFVENYGTPEARNVDEDSFLVIGKDGDDSGNLLGFLRKAGERFNQDSIMFKSFDNEHAFLYGTSRDNPDAFPGYGSTHDLGVWHPNRMAEFYSAMYPGASFTFTSQHKAKRTCEGVQFYKVRTNSSRGVDELF